MFVSVDIGAKGLRFRVTEVTFPEHHQALLCLF
jgi:hypothetical protein